MIWEVGGADVWSLMNGEDEGDDDGMRETGRAVSICGFGYV